MEERQDALCEAIQSSLDESPFDLSTTVRQVRLALDTAACHVSSDLKHRPRASSRSPSRRSIPIMNRSHSTSNIMEAAGGSTRPMTPTQRNSPRASYSSKPAGQQHQPQHIIPGSCLVNNHPVFVSPATHCFADYFQARKAGTAADALYSRQSTSKSCESWPNNSKQPTRKSPNAPSYYKTEPCSPCGLKSVLARLEQVRPATVVLQQMRSASADVSCMLRLQHGSGHGTGVGQQLYAAATSSHIPVNIKPAAGQASAPGTVKGTFETDLPGLLTPMPNKRPWSGAQSPVQQRPVSPQNMLVLRTLALHTPHNIVPPVLQEPGSNSCARQATHCCAPHSPQYGQGSSCRQAFRGTGSLSVALPGSPLHHLFCGGCNQMHAMQQHQSCCHRCSSCCTCNGKAAAGQQQQPPAAESSSASSEACNCPCIRAYKKGQRDAHKEAAGQAPAPAAAARVSDLAADLQDTMAAMELTDAAVADALAQATDNAAAAAAATAAAVTEMGDAPATDKTDSLMEVLQQLAAVQEDLLSQGPPFDADQLGEVADQLAECVANSQPQHEQLLRQVLEQQQQLLAVQQRALLGSTSGAGAKSPLLQPPQLQLQQNQRGWGNLNALELPQELGASAAAAADSAARERTGSWITQHHAQQQQQQGQSKSYPVVNTQQPGSAGAIGFQQGFELGVEQGFDRPLAARLPAGASVSSPKVPTAQQTHNSTFSDVDKMFGRGMSEEDMLAAAAAAYADVPEAAKPAAQHGSYSRIGSSVSHQAGKQSSFAIGGGWQQGRAKSWTIQELAEAMAGHKIFLTQQKTDIAYPQQHLINSNESSKWKDRDEHAVPTRSKMPGMDEIESVIAAYNAAGVFQSPPKQQPEAVLHFMMVPQHTSGAGGESWAGGAVLHQGPPQVTAVAQLVHTPSGLSRLSSGAGQITRPSGAMTAEGGGVSPSSRSIADSAWSVLATGANAAAAPHQVTSASTSPMGLPSPQAHVQQQSSGSNSPSIAQQQQQRVQWQDSHAESTAMAASRLSTLLPSNSSPSAGLKLASPLSADAVPVSQSPGSGTNLSSRTVSERDYLESQLSRLSSVRQGGSNPGSIAGTPRGSRLATAQGGHLTASGAQPLSQRPSLRFIDGQFYQADSEAGYPEQLVAAFVPKQQQPIVHVQVQPQQPVELIMQGEAQKQSQPQQYRSLVAARAGSFQAPESELSSAAASARPSASQLSLLQPQLAGGGSVLAAAATAVAAQHTSTATWSRSVSTAAARQGSTDPQRAGSKESQEIAANRVTGASGSASPASIVPRSSHTFKTPVVNNVATTSRSSHSSDMPGLDKLHRYQQLELEQLASPVASMPASTRTSFVQHLPSASGVRESAQQAQHHICWQQKQQQTALRSGDSMAKRLQAEGSCQSITATSGPAGSTPVSQGGSGDWKQQQVLMQQQLAVQQQQLKQLQSLGNSAVNSPRSSRGPVSRSTMVGSSSVINAAAAGFAAAARVSSVIGCSNNSSCMTLATNSLFEGAAAAMAHSPSVQTSGQAMLKKQPGTQSLQTRISRSPPRTKGNASSAVARPAAAKLTAELVKNTHTEGEGTGEEGSNGDQAVLHHVLLERLLLRRKGRLMQKALSTWWRYTVAIRTLTQESELSSRRSSNVGDHAAGQSGVNLAFSGLQELKKGLVAAVQGHSSIAEDVDIVISGQVRLQCSPVRQRPQSAGVMEADAVTSLSAAVAAKRKGNSKWWGSPDIAAARAKAALAVAANRSPERCHSIGKAAAAAAERAAADAAAEAFAAQAKPLQDALREVHSMIAEMENMCGPGGAMSGNAATNRSLTHKIAPGVAAAVVKACRGSPWDALHRQQQQQQQQRSSSMPDCSTAAHTHMEQRQQQQQTQSQTVFRSPDKHKLRGQLHHVQDRLSRLEVKMNQAGAMHEGPCFCNSAADSMSRARSPTSRNPQRIMRKQYAEQQHDEQCGGCGSKCKGGCSRRVAAKRQGLVGRMQDEIGQLQCELAELRSMMPGAYV